MKPMVRRTATVAALAAIGVLGTAVPAAAHVTIDPTEAAPGDYSRLTFKVPNESEDAATVKLEVQLPEDTPLASVQTNKVPGWEAKLKETKLDKPIDLHGREVDEAVSTVTWTAEEESDGVQPEEFAEFGLDVGPLPEKESTLFFKTIQTYSDGEEAAWIEEPEGGGEPDSPAPELKVTKQAASAEGHSQAEQATQDGGADIGTVILIAAIAVVVNLVILAVALLGFRRRANSGNG